MITFCKKCGINWAALFVFDDEQNDEHYECCPKCKSDMFLEPGNDIVAYIKCPFTGKIINVETKEELVTVPALLQPISRKKVWDESFEEWKARAVQVEDSTPLNIPVPKVERKYHYETN